MTNTNKQKVVRIRKKGKVKSKPRLKLI